MKEYIYIVQWRGRKKGKEAWGCTQVKLDQPLVGVTAINIAADKIKRANGLKLLPTLLNFTLIFGKEVGT